MNNTIIKIQFKNNRYEPVDANNKVVPVDGLRYNMKKQAYDGGMALKNTSDDPKNPHWVFCEMDELMRPTVPTGVSSVDDITKVDTNDRQQVLNAIHTSIQHKPKELIMSEVKWKHMVRTVIRAKNLMLTGSSGCGKTFAVKNVAKALGRDFYYFNMGSTQDPRSALIGNTHFKDGEGTLFVESEFIKAIRTPNSVILLDEISRSHPEAWNIILTVLDPIQRYVRLDEHLDGKVVEVADGVTFVATANIGNQYTATRVLDRALLDRFAIIEVDELDKEGESRLLNLLHDDLDESMVDFITSVTTWTREEMRNDTTNLSEYLSTRTAVEMAELAVDGFTREEIAETLIYPRFSQDGGATSERSYVMQYLQSFFDTDGTKDGLFSNGDGEEPPPF